MHKDLPAVASKIASALATKAEHFVTHPAELDVLHALSDAELRTFACQHGWRVMRRVGGRQIEFYNDAALRANIEQ